MTLAAAATALRAGTAELTLRPSGHSMTGIIHHRQRVTLRPLRPDETPAVGDVVLVKLRGRWLLHRVKRVSAGSYTIANARGRENGGAQLRDIAGIVETIHDD